MRKFLAITTAFAAAFILVSCSSANALTGKSWQLTAITEKVPAFQGVVPPADQARYTITFNTDLSFTALADCNNLGGTYTTSGSNMTITLGPSTLVACPEGSMGDLYAHALSRATSYTTANDQLTITLNDGGTLVFAAAPTASPAATSSAGPATTPKSSPTSKPTPKPSAPAASPTPTASPTAKATAQPSSAASAKPSAAATATPTAAPSKAPTPAPSAGTGLVGPLWQLTTITEKVPAFQGVVPEADQTKYTVTFGSDGTFQAQADCNQVSGTYTTTSAGGLTIELGQSTLIACPAGSLSDLYVLGLGNAASYAIANGQLTITLGDQGTLVYKQGSAS